MITAIENLRDLRLNGSALPPTHGEAPIVEFTNDGGGWVGGGIAIIVSIISFFILWAIFAWLHKEGAALAAVSYGLSAGIWAAVLYYVYPVFLMLFVLVKHNQLPTRAMVKEHSVAQRIASCILISFGLVYIFNHGLGIILSLSQIHPSLKSTYITVLWHYVVISIALGVALACIAPRILPKEVKSGPKRAKSKRIISPENAEFGLWVGRSTGHLSELWHRTGLAANQDITLSAEDACQNIFVLGGIGSGKTTRLMQPLLAQLLDQECGGLLFDVKGDVKNAAISLASHCEREVVFIGPGHGNLNLLAGLTPEIAASFLKSAFLLSGGARMDGFWVDTATELCRNTLGVLSFLPDYYTLQDLYSYLFDDEFKTGIDEEIDLLLTSLESKEQRLLKSYLRYHDNIFATFDEKVKSGVTATVAQALAPFNHPELIDAFCEQTEESLDLTSLLDGVIFLVDMPLARWGLGAKVAYTFIKLRFFNMMQNRVHNPDWNQDRPVFFMCDEYQDLVSASKDGLSDLNFWDKSRSSKTIGIISSQSVSSFYAAIGDHDLAHAVIQNFRQKFCFRTEDRATLTMMNDLAGQARVQRKTTSQSTTESFQSSSQGTSQSITEARESVLDAPLFRQLKQDQAIALLSVNGHSMDDLFNLMPVYIEN